MKITRLFILIAAATAGTFVYKAQRLIMEPGSSRGSGTDFYSSINGPGSLGQKIRSENAARTAAMNDDGTVRQHPGYNQPGPGQDEVTDDMPLLEAAAKGDKERVERRLAANAKVDSRDIKRRTPLMYASWNGYDDVCSRLLAAGANPEFKDRDGNNIFDYAAGRGLTDTLHFLLQRTHTKDERHYAEYAAIIQATFAGDASKLPPGTGKLTSVNRINPEGYTPLQIAAGNGSAALMDALLRRGAQVDLANSNRQTALQWAAWNNQPQAIELLLSKGADISLADLAGNTPLILAAQNGSNDAVQLLLKKGADRYLANKQGKTAAIVAEDTGFAALANLLK